MKKFLVSIVLVLFLGGLFALESLPSDVVGFIKFGLVTTASTNSNHVGYALDMGFTTSSDLTTSIGATSVSNWNAANQAWQTYVAGGPPPTEFAVTDGMGYACDISADTDWYCVGSLFSPVSFSFITTASTDANMFTLPLNKTALTGASGSSLVLADMGVANAASISYWNVPAQAWATQTAGGPPPTYFATYIGYPYQIAALQAFTWPTRAAANNVTKVKKATMLK